MTQERREEVGVTANGHGNFFWSDEDVLELDDGDDCTALEIHYRLFVK